jgi:2,4-dienoyl-CoA reductase-like NADH-dependent reductase (Old Yellow Enzyme family)
MAKYFTYPTQEALLAGAKEMGFEDIIEVDNDFSSLLQPVVVGGRKVGNRLGIHPMEGCDSELDGNPGQLTTRRWDRFGHGGCKLIWGEAVAIMDEARANTRQLWIHEGSQYGIRELLEGARRKHREAWGVDACSDLLLGCQLTHSGRYSYRKPLIVQHDASLDPVTMALMENGSKAPIPANYPLMTDDDLKRVEDAYVVAAKIAVDVGFDFLDIKQCHRYLLSELLASHTRPGLYGGSFENRTRLVRNVVGRIRSEVSKDIILGTRINMSDFVPYMKGSDGIGCPRPYTTPYKWSFGVNPDAPEDYDLSEPKQLVKVLSDLGMTIFNLSMGNPYNNPHFGRPAEIPPLDAYSFPEHPLAGVARHFKMAAEMQLAFPDVAFVGTGYSWLQHHFLACGAANVKKNRITFVGMGRGAFAYPDFVRDLKERGCIDNSKVCIAVSSCTALMRAKGNEQGQYPSGCVPKDKFYGPIYREAINNYKAGNKPKPKND